MVVGFTCDDALSGVASCPPAQTLGEGADQSATGTVTDKAGNEATATESDINVDKTPPDAQRRADHRAQRARAGTRTT